MEESFTYQLNIIYISITYYLHIHISIFNIKYWTISKICTHDYVYYRNFIYISITYYLHIYTVRSASAEHRILAGPIQI